MSECIEKSSIGLHSGWM